MTSLLYGTAFGNPGVGVEVDFQSTGLRVSTPFGKRLSEPGGPVLFKEPNSPVTFSHTNQDAMAVVPNRRKTLGFDPLAIAKGSVALTG